MQFDRPVLSVILPVFNCQKYLGDAIESILNQTFGDFELLIADDGSLDDSKIIIDDYARRDRRVRQFVNQENKGKVWTCNNLVQYCQGEYITVHDSDDVSHGRRFERQLDLLRRKPELVMCGTSFRVIKEDGSPFQEVSMPSNFKEILARISESSQFHGPTMVVRKAALNGCLYRPFFEGYKEDCDLAFRLVEKGECINLSAPLYTYRIRAGSLSKNITAKKKVLYEMALGFHLQRIMHDGTDDLMRGNDDIVQEKLNGLMQPYIKDPSLIYRENAAFFMYYQLHKQAIFNALKAVARKPLHFGNMRTLQYCIRKTLL